MTAGLRPLKKAEAPSVCAMLAAVPNRPSCAEPANLVWSCSLTFTTSAAQNRALSSKFEERVGMSGKSSKRATHLQEA